ncbi:MAG: hypothetical protein M0P47_09325 [Bacteroidales bacterium]|nr:hypothetical protein [Bacteroidales bacterium]
MNLPSRPDRREQATKEFERVGILERVTFIDSKPHPDGRIGLQTTLLSIFEDVLPRNIQNVLIFEDDVHFINDPVNKLRLALTDLKYSFNNKFDLLYLGATRTIPCLTVTSNLKLLRSGLAAHATCYNKSVYKPFSKHLTRVVKQGGIITDWDISDVFLATHIQNKGRSYMVHPVIATQEPGWSDIERRDVNYDFIQRSDY